MDEKSELQNKLVLERERWRVMLESDACRRLLKRLIETSGCLKPIPFEGSGREAYNKGRSDLVNTEIVARVTKFFGWGALDKILAKDD